MEHKHYIHLQEFFSANKMKGVLVNPGHIDEKDRYSKVDEFIREYNSSDLMKKYKELYSEYQMEGARVNTLMHFGLPMNSPKEEGTQRNFNFGEASPNISISRSLTKSQLLKR